MKIDDVVGALSAHLVAGRWRTLAAVGTFGSDAILVQLIGIATVGGFVSLFSGIV